MVGAACVATPDARAQTTLFSDSFSGNLSQWTFPTGVTPVISNGQLSVPKSLEIMRSAPVSTSWTDYQFNVSVNVTAVAVGLIFRSPDNSNGYMWQLSQQAQAVRLHKKVAGTYTLLRSTPCTLATGTVYQAQIVALGTTLNLYLNNKLVDSVTDATFSSGAVGFRTGSTETAVADNVVVTTIVPPGVPTGFAVGPQWNAGSPVAALSWSASASGIAAGFLLERRVSGTANYARLTGLNSSAASFKDYWIQPNTSYDYRLSAFSSYGSSTYTTATFPPATALPLGYVNWAQAIVPAAGGSLAAGTRWMDSTVYGYPNAFAYAFSGNPAVGTGTPGGLFVASASSNPVQVWGNSFVARTDTHYQLQGSPDLSGWTTYLDEASTPFAAVSGGAGTSSALLSINPSSSAPKFFRWSISPNASASATPTGMLVNGLAGTSGATLTQMAPVFGWQNGNDTQTAYQILVSTSPSLLTESTADVWNSGKVTGAGSINIAFAGLALKSNTTYYWTVRTWNSAGLVSTFGTTQTFATGTLSAAYRTDPPRVALESVAPVSIVQKGTGWYFIDFGNDAFGKVALTIPSPVAGQVITVGMGEQLSAANTVNASPSGYIRYQSQSITMQSGVTSYTVTPSWTALYSGYVSPPSYIGQVAPFRYVEIKNVPEPFTASQIMQLAAHVPFDDGAATFTSSDALLNSIFALCKYTTKATTFTGYVMDGDRERIPYEADAYIAMLNALCLNRDYATARYSHEYMLTHATWPAEWLMHSIFMAYTDYLYTGDTRSLAANYTVLQTKLPNNTSSPWKLSGSTPRVRSDGLFTGTTTSGSGSYPSSITDIVDWPAGERGGYDMAMPVKTVTSAFYYQSLVYMQQIATVLGKSSDASTYQSAAALTLGSLNSKLFDSSYGAYRDGMTSAGAADASYSLHANFFPLAFGMVPAASQAGVVGYVESLLAAANYDLICSPYGAQYLLEALYSAGEGNFALSLFDSTAQRSWYNMIQTGTTMTQEAWDVSLKTNEDWSHVWGAAAGNLIPRWLMGVRPLTPGFRKMIIQPQPGTLSYASMTMPTVRGPVSVNVQANTSTDFSMNVNVPANTTAKVGLPTLGSTSTAVSMDGASVVGTINGSTIWIDNVNPGPHLFERQP